MKLRQHKLPKVPQILLQFRSSIKGKFCIGSVYIWNVLWGVEVAASCGSDDFFAIF